MIEEGENGKAVKLLNLLVKRAGAKMAPLGEENCVVRSRFDTECSEVENSARNALKLFRHHSDVVLCWKGTKFYLSKYSYLWFARCYDAAFP